MQYKKLFQEAERLKPEERQWEAIKRDFVASKKIRPLFGLSWPRAAVAVFATGILLTFLWLGKRNADSPQLSELDLYTWYSDLGEFASSENTDFDSLLISMESDEFWPEGKN